MKKGKLLLILSSLSLLVPTTFVEASFQTLAEGDVVSFENDLPNINNALNPEDGHYILEYQDEEKENDIYRYYEGYDVGVIEENFRAPGGCVLTISPNLSFLQDVRFDLQEHRFFANKDSIKMVNISIYRHINGAKMYSESICAWDVRREDLELYIRDNLSSLIVYEINDKISDVDVSASVEISLFTSYGEDNTSVGMFLNFDVEPYHVKKYAPGDILALSVGYYNGERVIVQANINENFFNEKFGFKTDGREQYPWDENGYWENYLIQYFDKDTNLILDTDNAHDQTPGIEFQNIPTKPIHIFALLSFKSAGVEYKFYSNEMSIENPINGLLIDGYNNRKSIGVNTTHKLKLDVAHDYDDVFSAWMHVNILNTDYEVCNHICEPQYYQYDDPSMQKFTSVTDSFWEFGFKYHTVGEYVLHFNVAIEGGKEQLFEEFDLPIIITQTQEEYTPLDEALILNIEEQRINCLAGGGVIDLEAFIAQDVLNDGETPIFEWVASRLNVVEITHNDNKISVNPIGSGVVTLSVTCYGKAFGSISKSIVLNVVDDIYSITTLSIPDEFHYSSKDLTVGLNIERYGAFVNFHPEWKVINSKDEEIPFIDNGNCSITISSPSQDDYTVTAFYNGVEIDSEVIEVRNVNIDEYIKRNIIWIALITFGFIGLVVFLKYFLEKKGSLVSKIEKTNAKFASIDRNDPNVLKQLNKIRMSIIADIDYARNLNMNALNEYEKIIRYLGKSLSGIKALSKKSNSLSKDEFNQAYNQLSKDLAKALIVAKEIEDAKNLAMKNSFMANENNIATVEQKEKPKKKDTK